MSHQPNPDSSGEIAWPPYDTANVPVALTNKPKICKWTDNYDSVWTSDCNEACDLLGESGPDHEGWRFCPFCGKPLQAVRP